MQTNPMFCKAAPTSIMGLRAQPRSTTFTHRTKENTAPKKKQVPSRVTPWVVEIPAHSKCVFVTRFIRVFFDSISILYVMFGVVQAIEGEQGTH